VGDPFDSYILSDFKIGLLVVECDDVASTFVSADESAEVAWKSYQITHPARDSEMIIRKYSRKLVGNGPVTEHGMEISVAYTGVCEN
jgi:hypothetical protein